MEPPFQRLIGCEPETTTQLFDYGYRAAWRAAAACGEFLVKHDARGEFAEREVAANRHAAGTGIPVPELVATTGEPVDYMAFRWVPGVTLDDLETAEAWRNAGRMLRHLHDAPMPPSDPPRDHLAWFGDELGWMVDFGAVTIAEAQSALAIARRTLTHEFPGAWIHGDCQAAHFVIAPDNSVAALIDWADAQHGPPEMDLAVLTLFHSWALPLVLDGYGAPAGFLRGLPERIAVYQAIRAAGSLRWLESHGYPGHTWPAERVRALGGT